jgi:hypothetical protein
MDCFQPALVLLGVLQLFVLQLHLLTPMEL